MSDCCPNPEIVDLRVSDQFTLPTDGVTTIDVFDLEAANGIIPSGSVTVTIQNSQDGAGDPCFDELLVTVTKTNGNIETFNVPIGSSRTRAISNISLITLGPVDSESCTTNASGHYTIDLTYCRQCQITASAPPV